MPESLTYVLGMGEKKQRHCLNHGRWQRPTPDNVICSHMHTHKHAHAHHTRAYTSMHTPPYTSRHTCTHTPHTYKLSWYLRLAEGFFLVPTLYAQHKPRCQLFQSGYFKFTVHTASRGFNLRPFLLWVTWEAGYVFRVGKQTWLHTLQRADLLVF